MRATILFLLFIGAVTGSAAFACGQDGSKAPVKVYVLSGQSNMVGIGQVTGGGTRWGEEFTEPEVSVYAGEYDAQTDYDAQQPIEILKLDSFGGVHPTA